MPSVSLSIPPPPNPVAGRGELFISIYYRVWMACSVWYTKAIRPCKVGKTGGHALLGLSMPASNTDWRPGAAALLWLLSTFGLSLVNPSLHWKYLGGGMQVDWLG
jgi:hypothetical protein